MSTRWDAAQYLKYEDERGRPFVDLLSRVNHPAPAEVVDLGCGPGNTTAQLVERWPDARILGLDSSAEMITKAKDLAVPGHLDFRQQDLREWEPEAPVDVLLSCATLHWVPGHIELFPRFVDALAPGGYFAFQVPANFDQPSHRLLNELATSDRWGPKLAQMVRGTPIERPEEYLDALLAAGTRADVWETTYLHVLHGPDPVLEWVSGTGLRPFLTALEENGSPGDVDEFLTIYSTSLRAAYPADEMGRTVFPFRRVFGVAAKPGRLD